MTDLNPMLEPGQIVRHPTEAGWGLGQVQSNINGKITVMFEQAGKIVIDGRKIALLPVFNV
ncbi:DUF3553 domain-containing protein [Candidatus Halocynthiibacter alkanivorans]|jgi:ABC-type uncharacterized transport system YnjBCD ATPase subunit|uniref:DUF3553 domain-containing protein n=1 Tax=Candidatus Halocynthiibacter alkanivorans TaxID=2267619 RepID=UPI000DF1431F|nr:DUF3553 domain-containing protein [Candidatus Halocynthiibacter alkanivorans]